MKRMLFAITLFAVLFAGSVDAQRPDNGTARTTRYWDSCKPSCGWTANANPACVDCDARGALLSNRNTQSICNNGSSYTCMFQAPFTGSDGRAYGFAASHTNGDCGRCYELTFTSTSISGKKMVIMVTNIGGDVANNQFDLMIPGGGVGMFNGLTRQLQENGVNNPNLGAQYGGFRQTCGNNATCVRQMCDQNFSTPGLADLRAGCHWYVDWFEIADNPNANYTRVTCPPELDSRYRGTTTTYGGSGGNVTTRTLTINRLPNNQAGSVTVNGTAYTAPTTHNNGASVTLVATPASGFTFVNWTGDGAPTGAAASNATATITMSANRTITANFQQQQTTTRTLTINRLPNNQAGSVTVNGTAYTAPTTHNDGASVTLVATPASGFTFVNWTGDGAPTGAAASNATATITMSANRTITANFQQSGSNDQRTLTINRNPTAGGNVTVNGTQQNSGASNHANNASITVVATPNSGYTFQNWTGAPSGVTATNASITFNITSNVTLTANFQQSGTTDPDNLVRDGSFPGSSLNSSNWEIQNNDGNRATASVSGGSVTLNINSVGGNPWEPQLIQRRINLINGENYRLTFTASAAANRSMVVLVQRVGGDDGSGWTAYAEQTFNLTTTPQTFTLDFRMDQPSDPNTQLAFNLGGSSTQNVIISNVRLVRVTTSIRHSVARIGENRARSQVTLRSTLQGFSALLPADHSYHSYSLIDLQGREIRSGRVDFGATELNFTNINNSVLFLRLRGRDATTVLRATTF